MVRAVSDLRRRPRGSRLQSALTHVGHRPLLWTLRKEILPVLTLLSDSRGAGTQVAREENSKNSAGPQARSQEIVNSNHRRTASGTGAIFVNLE